jgi:uncharacterized protein YcbX
VPAAVVELWSYPVKGCAGIPAERTVVTPAGPAHDRGFMVVGEDGVFRTQRRDPRMALIRPEIDAAGTWLTLRAPGAGAVSVEVDTAGARRDVRLFGSPYLGIDQGGPVADWLSDVLGERSRLVRVPPEHDRVTGGETPGTAGYADGGPLLVVSRSSLGLLNDRLAERGAAPLPMNRFRANIVVDGWPEPHTEDRARRIAVGGAELGYAKLATRCVVTTVEQESGVKRGPEPLRTLAGYRRVAGGVAFGAKFAVLRPGPVSVGDALAVAAWAVAEREPEPA